MKRRKMTKEQEEKFHAAGNMDVVKKGLGIVKEALGKPYDIAQSSPAINNAANKGRDELSRALFHQSNAFVQYGNDGGADLQTEEQKLDKAVEQTKRDRKASRIVDREEHFEGLGRPSPEMQRPEIHRSKETERTQDNDYGNEM